jgi:cellulose synthase/poly-beta-1,6-N-acetylglucosamine synthase-like glycosyltransferase/peptidoglycan/xylan/chitin deacetylase (PgdA/CDA1 family)
VVPVFFDASGKRWHRILAGLALLVIPVTTVIAMFTVSALRPVWNAPENWGSGYPERLLSEANAHNIPVIGDEGVDVLVRVDLVRHRAGVTYLVDPFSGRVIRTATPDEVSAIGKYPYVLEWYGQPAAHRLVLTFDDGPDPQNTPEILNILGRDHVPATFFLIGVNAARSPAIVQREIREGHVVGNHTLTHIDAGHGSLIDREEIIGDERIIRAIAGYDTRLFRIPNSDADDNPLLVLEAQQLGYIVVDLDLDTHDYQYKPGQTVPLPKLDGRGHVVLMHDGGANRAATIRLLPRLIAEAKADGYTFTTVDSLVPSQYWPRRVTPSIADRFTLYAAWTAWVLPQDLVNWLFWFGIGSLTIMSLAYVVLALINAHRQSRRVWPEVSGVPTLVTVALPVYNEEKVVAKTLAGLARSDYPAFEVVAVDDGSSDDTWGVLTDFASVWPRLRIFRQEVNQGKAAALNRVIAHARGEIIVTLDGDTVFERQTISRLARHFADPRVGVVAGQVKVGNRRNIWTAWQSLEYISGVCVTRMAEGLVGAITIAPGACAAWRRRVVLEAGGYSLRTLAEDCNLTLAIQQLGYKVSLDNSAVGWTEAPMTVRGLARQRVRWTFGVLQALRNHREMVLRPRYGILGMVVLPYALLSIAVPLLFMPLTYVVSGMCIASGNWKPLAEFAVFILGIQLVMAIVAIRMLRERRWHLLMVPLYRLIYEPLRAYVLYRSLLIITMGKRLAWFRPARTNTV